MRGRRAFLATVAAALVAAPFSTLGQQPSPTLRRIGFLGSESASNQAKRLDATPSLFKGTRCLPSTPKRSRLSR